MKTINDSPRANAPPNKLTVYAVPARGICGSMGQRGAPQFTWGARCSSADVIRRWNEQGRGGSTRRFTDHCKEKTHGEI